MKKFNEKEYINEYNKKNINVLIQGYYQKKQKRLIRY
jgi:hypothetical protein